MPGLSYYRKLKVKKTFPNGKHAKLVALLENGVVKKAYHNVHRDIFEHEVRALKKLQGLKFIPKLLYVDDEKRTFYMAYCGKTLSNFGPYRHKIQKYQKKLQEEYGFFHNDIREGNVCLNKGQIYFIDFGWARDYPGIGGYGEGKIGHPDTEVPVKQLATPFIEKKIPTSRQDLLNLLLSIYVGEELETDYIKEKVHEILVQEKMIPPEIEDPPTNLTNRKQHIDFSDSESSEASSSGPPPVLETPSVDDESFIDSELSS